MATKKTAKKKTTARPANSPIAGGKPTDPAQPVTPPDDPTRPGPGEDQLPPGPDPVDPPPDDQAEPGDPAPDDPMAAIPELDLRAMFPEAFEERADYEPQFPEFEREDYSVEIAKVRAEAKILIERAEALEADYNQRWPQGRTLPEAVQNKINMAHHKHRLKIERAKRAGQADAVKALEGQAATLKGLLGPSVLDQVLRSRGKNPALKRKPPRALQTD